MMTCQSWVDLRYGATFVFHSRDRVSEIDITIDKNVLTAALNNSTFGDLWIDGCQAT